MKNLEKLIWLALIALMITVLGIVYFDADKLDKREQPEQVETEEKRKDSNEGWFLLEVDIEDGSSLSMHMNKESPKLMFRKPKDTKIRSRVDLEIGVHDQSFEYYSANTLNGKEIKKTAGGVEYWEDDLWVSTPETLMFSNVKREFYIHRKGEVLLITQYDYSGGAHDEEIEKFVDGIFFREFSWFVE